MRMVMLESWMRLLVSDIALTAGIQEGRHVVKTQNLRDHKAKGAWRAYCPDDVSLAGI